MRVVIVGGGVLGTMHAWHAVQRGHDVLQLEREPAARGASVRNFGLIWVGGRAAAELEFTLRARELWQRIAADVPDLGFRANGSLTIARTEAELTVARDVLTRADATDRGFKLLGSAEARAYNPALRGDFLGALWCDRDAAVEPRTAQVALRRALTATGRYAFQAGREVREIHSGRVRDDHGSWHAGDVVVLCPGAQLAGLVRELVPEIPVRRVRLQMMQTDPLGESLPTSVADGDSLRYYPAFAGHTLDALRADQPQNAAAAEHKMQLLMVQRLDGSLTVGDTHCYDEPFPFDTAEHPYEHLQDTAAAILGRPLPPVRHRWAGVYAECLDRSHVAFRQEIADRVVLVTGPGGRGMTMSPAIAETTVDQLNL